MAASQGTRKRRGRPSREAFFVLVDQGDGNASFFNASDHIGKAMPFTKPQATCAMRVGDSTVAFSMLRLSKSNMAAVTDRPIAMPTGPLARLERRAAGHQAERPLAADELIVEISTRLPVERTEDPEPKSSTPGDDLAALLDAPAAGPAADAAASSLEDLFAEPATPAQAAEGTPAGGEADDRPKRRPQRPSRIDTYRCKIRRDENNVAFIEEDAEEDTLIEVPRGALNVSLYLKGSERSGRTLAIGFIGPLGRKPGTLESITRIASLVLNSAARLTEFRLLAEIETVNTPAEPARAAAANRPVRRPEERAEFPVRLYLFDDALAPVATGDVVVSFDLENANPSTGRLLVHYTPDDSIAGLFDRYRPMVDMMLTQTMRTVLGDEQIEDITYDIVLGSVDAGVAGRLRDVGRHIQALDVSPTNVRPHVD